TRRPAGGGGRPDRWAPSAGGSCDLLEVGDDERRTGVGQGLVADAPVDPDHRPEAAVGPGLDPGDGVLVDHGLAEGDAEQLGGAHVGVRCGFAGQALLGGDVAVHDVLEAVQQARPPQHLPGVAGGGDDRQAGRGGERVEEGDGAGVGLYTCGADQVQYQV